MIIYQITLYVVTFNCLLLETQFLIGHQNGCIVLWDNVEKIPLITYSSLQVNTASLCIVCVWFYDNILHLYGKRHLMSIVDINNALPITTIWIADINNSST